MTRDIKKNLFFFILFLVVTGFFAFRHYSTNIPPADEQNSVVDEGAETEALIRVDMPVENTLIKNPVKLSGEARGSWYFEASFPVRIEDVNGNVLGQHFLQADGEWMTTEFVPFSGELPYVPPPVTTTGYIIFQKDNPSGLAEFDDEYRLPVVIAPLQKELMSLEVYFGNSSILGENEDECVTVFPTERQVVKTLSVGRISLEELLKGPTEEEKFGDYYTSLPSDVELTSLEIKDGVAYVDFSEELNNVAGSCRVMAIRRQIEETLKQFETVNSVVISIDGRTDDILQP